MATWRCRVCGFLYTGRKPPKVCPQCSSPADEFTDMEDMRLKYDGESFDVLLINGSTHSSHNTSILVDIVEQELRNKGVSYRRFNLSEWNIQHCWCCYSIADQECTYPCRNQLDDMSTFHEMIIKSRALIIASPINWNNMSARLKDFLDRTTCIQNLPLTGKKSPTQCKIAAIIINGHEDGALKTAMDIFVYLQQMGYILAPFGFAYRTHSAEKNTKTDNLFLKKDKKIREDIKKVVNNLIETMRENLETKLADKIKPISE